MILQNPVSGCQYTFELNDRLIRDDEFDGWREIAIKLEGDLTGSSAGDVEQHDTISNLPKESLPGMYVCKQLIS